MSQSLAAVSLYSLNCVLPFSDWVTSSMSRCLAAASLYSMTAVLPGHLLHESLPGGRLSVLYELCPTFLQLAATSSMSHCLAAASLYSVAIGGHLSVLYVLCPTFL
jgi:hypothetical protein